MFESIPNISAKMNLGEYRQQFHLSQQTAGRVHRGRPVPAWAYSTDAFQRVLLERLRRYICSGGTGISRVEANKLNLEKLVVMAAKYEPKTGSFAPNFVTHVKSLNNRSIVALWAFIAWHAYRLGESSVDIGLQLSIRPESVRQCLHRLNESARAVVPELCQPKRLYGGGYSREDYLDAVEKNILRMLARSKSHKTSLEARLASIRKMKAEREKLRQEATVCTKESLRETAALAA